MTSIEDDQRLRVEALNEAVRIELANTGAGDGQATVVARAEAFYGFLTGSRAEAGSEKPVLVDHDFLGIAPDRAVLGMASPHVCIEAIISVEGDARRCGLPRDRHPS